jgi:2-iminobutanoate/2-iminopropanoate deaminase
MKHVIQTTDVLSYEQFGFTNCVRFGDVLYLSGISALDPRGQVLGSDIETQTIHTYRNIERVLRAGGSGLDQILQMTSFVLDLERNGARYVAARQKILISHTYTSAVIGVSALMMRGLLLEVQCCAAATDPGAAAARAAAEGGEIGVAEAEIDEESAGKQNEESKEVDGKEGEDGKEREENGPGSDLRCACPP